MFKKLKSFVKKIFYPVTHPVKTAKAVAKAAKKTWFGARDLVKGYTNEQINADPDKNFLRSGAWIIIRNRVRLRCIEQMIWFVITKFFQFVVYVFVTFKNRNGVAYA